MEAFSPGVSTNMCPRYRTRGSSLSWSQIKILLSCEILFCGLVDEGGSQMPSLGAVVVTDRITDMPEVFLLFDWGGLGP